MVTITKNKIIFILLVNIIVILSLNSLSLAYGQTEYKKPLKLALTVWIPNFLAYVAQEKGYFEKNNVDMNITLFQDYGNAVKAFANGEYDGIFLVYSDVIILNSEGVDSSVVYNLDSSYSADAIVGNGNSLLDVKGKKIGVEGINSFSHFFVLKSLEKIGLSEGDVEFVNVSAQNISKALDNGEIYAGHTYEPFVSNALNQGYKILFTGADNPGIITNVLAFHTELLDQKPEEIKNIVKSLNDAKQDFEINKEKDIQIMAAESGLTKNEVIGGITSPKLFDINYNVKFSMNKESNQTVSLYKTGSDIAQFYAERGVISDYPQIDRIIFPQFVNELQKQKQIPIS
jgi:NitT/TauT family transport system substrate-binding protein